MKTKNLAAAPKTRIGGGKFTLLLSVILMTITSLTAFARQSTPEDFDTDGTKVIGLTAEALADASLTELVIPATINGTAMKEIASKAFCGNVSGNYKRITSVVIEAGYTKIADQAFLNIDNLASISIPSTVTDLGGRAALAGTALTSVVLPDNAGTALGNTYFNDCKYLADITIGAKIERIQQQTFRIGSTGNVKYGTRKITIRNTNKMVTIENANTFQNTASTTTVDVPEGWGATYAADANWKEYFTDLGGKLTENGQPIGPGPEPEETIFAYTESNNQLTITGLVAGAVVPAVLEFPATINGKSVVAINCSSTSNFGNLQITKVTFPSSIKKITGDYVFQKCTKLETIEFAEGLEELGTRVFTDCSALKSVKLPASLKNISGRLIFNNCAALESAFIDDNVTNMNWGTFNDCTKLSTVVMGKGVTKLTQQTFRVDLSKKTLATDARVLVFRSPTMTTDATSVFEGTAAITKAYVPYGAKPAYLAGEAGTAAGAFWDIETQGKGIYEAVMEGNGGVMNDNISVNAEMGNAFSGRGFKKDATEYNGVLTAAYTLTDGEELLLEKDFKTKEINYTRATNGQSWGTICMPYALTSDETVQYYALYSVTVEGTEGEIQFVPVETVEANTPAAFKTAEASDLTIKIGDRTGSTRYDIIAPVEDLEQEATDDSGWKLVGVYETTPLATDDKAYYIAEDMFWHNPASQGGVTLRPFRAYIAAPAEEQESLTSFKIGIINPTDVQEIRENADGTVSVIFDLNGRRLSEPQRGAINIVNGKKVLVK